MPLDVSGNILHFKIVVRFSTGGRASRRVTDGVTPSYGNRCFHTEHPGCPVGSLERSLLFRNKRRSPRDPPRWTCQRHNGGAKVSRCGSVLLYNNTEEKPFRGQHCVFSLELTTKETVFLLGPFRKSIKWTSKRLNSPTFPNWKLPQGAFQNEL